MRKTKLVGPKVMHLLKVLVILVTVIIIDFFVLLYIFKISNVPWKGGPPAVLFEFCTFIVTTAYVLITALTLIAIKNQNNTSLKIFERQNRPYLVTSVKLKALEKEDLEIVPLDEDNKVFKEKLLEFYNKESLDEFKRLGLYLEVENRGMGDSMFSWIGYDLKLPTKDSILRQSDGWLIPSKRCVDKMNRVQQRRLIKAHDSEIFLIKEITYLPDFEFKIKSIFYISPVTQKGYNDFFGNSGLSSVNPNIADGKFYRKGSNKK